MRKNLIDVLPLLVLVMFMVLVLTVPWVTGPLIPYPLAAIIRVASVFLIVVTMVTRIQAKDFTGWTWGYAFIACLVVALSVATWEQKPAGRINTLLVFAAACVWTYSSLSQARRVGSSTARYE